MDTFLQDGRYALRGILKQPGFARAPQPGPKLGRGFWVERELEVPRQRYTPEPIITKLRQAEVELVRGQTTAEV